MKSTFLFFPPHYVACKAIQLVHPKGDQSWLFIGRTDAEAETPVFWPLYAKSWLIGKDPDAGRDWGQEEKGMTEDEVAGCHHRLDGMNLSKLRELVMDREAWRAGIHEVAKSRTWLSGWTDWLTDVACGILVLWPGIKPRLSAVEIQSPNHWTAREFPQIYISNSLSSSDCHSAYSDSSWIFPLTIW